MQLMTDLAWKVGSTAYLTTPAVTLPDAGTPVEIGEFLCTSSQVVGACSGEGTWVVGGVVWFFV